MNSISEIERFVALTNQLSYLISQKGIVLEYCRFKRVYEEYELLSIPSMTKEIESAAPDFNALQGYFDFAKCKLNDINLPNMALLDVSGLYEKDEVKIRGEAIEAWEYVLEKCGELRLSILDFADRYHLQDNYPKENFLQPPFVVALEKNTSVSIQVNKEEYVQPSEKTTPTDLDSNESSVNNEKKDVQTISEQTASNEQMQEEIEATEESLDAKYSLGLLKLFKNHTELIDELVGKSNDEIARLINKWARKRDGAGRALIENPRNNMRRTFARELKKNGLIKMSEDRFSRKLD